MNQRLLFLLMAVLLLAVSSTTTSITAQTVSADGHFWKCNYSKDTLIATSKATYYVTNGSFATPSTDNYYVEFDWVATVSSKNASLYFSTSTSEKTTNIQKGGFFKLRMGTNGSFTAKTVTSGKDDSGNVIEQTVGTNDTLHVSLFAYKDNGEMEITITDKNNGTVVGSYVLSSYYILKSFIGYCSGASVAILNIKEYGETFSMPDGYTQTAQNRALFACLNNEGNTFVSWRARATDNDNTSYRLYKNGGLIGTFTDKTNTIVNGGSITDNYKIEVYDNGIIDDSQTMTASVKEKPYFKIKLGPEPVYLYEGDYSDGGKLYWCAAENYNVNNLADHSADNYYTPNDCSAYDMDGDGEQEIILKWNPMTWQDNGYGSWTANTYIDCYKLDGTQLWRIDMGNNIRSGPHYTQMLCYDFDGDGKGEMMVITAPGTKDSKGNYVAGYEPSDGKVKDYSRGTYNHSGHIVDAPEYVTVFNGETGEELASTRFYPSYYDGVGKHGWDEPSSSANLWNKGTRWKAAVAFLDGTHPSAVFNRGYYTQTYWTAYNWNGKNLYELWRHNTSTTNVDGSLYGQGSHSLAVGDVDGDGRDEIIQGASAIDDDGNVLWSTGFGHGDATHLGEFDPDNDGMEFFYINEENSRNTLYSSALLDARTGKVLSGRSYDGYDTGRGVIGDFDSSREGAEYCTQVAGAYTDSYLTDCKGKEYAKWFSQGSLAKSYVSTDGIANDKESYPNFRIYWDGDLYDEWMDNRHVDKWDAENQTWSRVETFAVDGESVNSINSTKENPNLQADILGDWREEAIFYIKDGKDENGRDQYYLVVFTTTIPTEHKLPWLRDDHVYDMAVAWQNVGYNQPPHLSYSPVEKLKNSTVTAINDVETASNDDYKIFNLAGQHVTNPQKGINIINHKKIVIR